LKKVVPVIIGFSIESDMLSYVKTLNESCNRVDGIDFDSAVPHVTLWMGFVHEKDLHHVFEDYYCVFKNVSLDLKARCIDLFEGINGNVLSLSIINSFELETLQNRIHHYWEPYRIVQNEFQTFNKETVSYVNDFWKNSLSNYDPHITIGFCQEKTELNELNFSVNDPKIFLMGNNCTCQQVIRV